MVRLYLYEFDNQYRFIKSPKIEKSFDKNLIENIARAYKWKATIKEGQASSLPEVAEKNVTSSYVSRIFDLNFLSPRIVDRILN